MAASDGCPPSTSSRRPHLCSDLILPTPASGHRAKSRPRRGRVRGAPSRRVPLLAARTAIARPLATRGTRCGRHPMSRTDRCCSIQASDESTWSGRTRGSRCSRSRHRCRGQQIAHRERCSNGREADRHSCARSGLPGTTTRGGIGSRSPLSSRIDRCRRHQRFRFGNFDSIQVSTNSQNSVAFATISLASVSVAT